MQSTPDESSIPGVVGRRSARLSIIIPVTVRGIDSTGESFKENTWTISVNKHGGRIATFHQLAADDQIIVENPLLGRSAKARVIRVCEKRFAEDPYEVCVELLEAQNVWGVKLPPEDWLKDRAALPDDQKSATLQAVHQAGVNSAAAVGEGGKVETAQLAPPGTSAEVGEHPGGLSQFNMAVNALSRLAGEASALPAQPAPPRREAPGGPKAPVGYPPASDQPAFKSLQEKIDEAQSLKQELSALAARVQSAREEAENLLLKAHETQRQGVFEAEQAAKETLSKAVLDFQAQCKRAAEQTRAELDELVKSATTAAGVRLRKVMEEGPLAMGGPLGPSAEPVAKQQLEEFKAQIALARKSSDDSIQHTLEKMRQEIQAEALNAGVQARKIYKEEAGTAAKAISVCVDSAVDSLNRAGDEAAAKLQATRQSLELGLEKAAEECLARLRGEFPALLEKFRAEAKTLSPQLQSELESTARESLEKARREISEKLERTVEGALELVARDFNKQAEDALELLKEEFQSAREQCLEETREKLAAACQSALSSLENEAEAKSAFFRQQLNATLQEMLAQQSKEVEAGIQPSLQGLLESLRAKIQLTASESSARATAEVRSWAEQALQELPERLYKGVGMAALVAKEWEEQAKTHLEAHSHQLLELFQKQLEASTLAAQERQRSDAEAFQSVLRSRLAQAVRLFEGLETGAGPSRGATREEPESPLSQSPRPGREPLRPALEPRLEKQQRIIEEALGAFRSRLSQILADRPPKE